MPTATTDKTRSFGIGVKYNNGPLFVAAAYEMLRHPHVANSDASPQSFSLGLAYDFEVVKVHAAYAHTSDASTVGASMGGAAMGSGPSLALIGGTGSGGPGGFLGTWNSSFANNYDGLSMNGYSLGVTVPVGKATKILAQVQFVDPSLPGGLPAAIKDAVDNSMQIYNLAVTYDLSKRTNLYAIAGYARHWYFDKNTSARALAVGLRHQF
jgi:predicted porin